MFPLQSLFERAHSPLIPLPALLAPCFCSAREGKLSLDDHLHVSVCTKWVSFIVHKQLCACISQCLDRCDNSVLLNVHFYTFFSQTPSPACLFCVTGSSLIAVPIIEPTFTESSHTLISTGSKGSLIQSEIFKGIEVVS